MPFFLINISMGIGLRIYLLSLFILVLFVIAFIFASQNNQVVDFNYLIAQAQLTVAQMVSIFTGLGFCLGLFTAMLWKLLAALRTRKTFNQDIKAR